MPSAERSAFDRAPMPLGPRVATDGLFESLADQLVPTLGASDDVLGPQQERIAGNSGDGFDATYSHTIGVADDELGQQAGQGPTTETDVWIDHGAGVDAHRAAAAPYLPQATTPITFDYRDPPDPHTFPNDGRDDRPRKGEEPPNPRPEPPGPPPPPPAPPGPGQPPPPPPPPPAPPGPGQPPPEPEPPAPPPPGPGPGGPGDGRPGPGKDV